MIINFTLSIILQCVSLTLSLVMIIYFLVIGKKTPVLFAYIWCQFMILIWSGGQIIVTLSSNKYIKYIVDMKFEYISVCFIGLSWLIFCLLYTNNNAISNKKLITFLFFPPTLILIFVFTNEYHWLFYREKGGYGVLFWIHTFENYFYILIGTFLLVKYSLKQFGYAKKQSILLVFAVFFPLISNAAYLFNPRYIGMDLTPVSFAISLLFFSLATFRYRFLNIVPMAMRKIVDNMKEAIVVVDNFNKIINFNAAFTDTFPGCSSIMNNDDINIFIKILEERLKKDIDSLGTLDSIVKPEVISYYGELTLFKPSFKTYSVTIQPVFRRNKEVLGRVISFNDVTEYKRLLDELSEKNYELSAMNEQLKEYAATVEELAIAKERNRFARDIHDTLGHTMTLLIALLEVSSITCKKDLEKTEEKLHEAIDVAREGLKEVRRSISGLKPEKLETNDMLNALKRMIFEFEKSGLKIDFSFEGDEKYDSAAFSDVLFRVCQEALTNSLRHGKAKHVNIILKFTNERIKLFIFDDGIGCSSINKGFGLKGMEQRVNGLNGKIVYGSDGESGFNIRVEIPVEEGT
jgi:signal transduction histidine kinase